MFRISGTSAWLKWHWKFHLLHFSRMILVQKINIEWRQNFALIKRSKMPPLVDSPAKTLRMRSRFSALSSKLEAEHLSPTLFCGKPPSCCMVWTMSRRILTDVKIVDIQKRKIPSKHYVSTTKIMDPVITNLVQYVFCSVHAWLTLRLS